MTLPPAPPGTAPFADGDRAGWGSTSLGRHPAVVLAEALDPARRSRDLPGRNRLWVARLADGQEVVVKEFPLDSARARLRRRHGGSLAARSYVAAAAIRAAGIESPEPLLVAAEGTPPQREWYVCRHLSDRVEARHVLRALAAGELAVRFPTLERRAFLAALGRLAARLHAGGIWYRDLSVGNILVALPPTAGERPAIAVVDTNRARLGTRPGLSRRMQDLARLPLRHADDRDELLRAYFGGGPPRGATALLAFHAGSFRRRQETKRQLRDAATRWRGRLLSRGVHAHIPTPAAGTATRERAVWDALSDQPHLHAGKWEKVAVRLADLPRHLGAVAGAVGALPRIRRRFRELRADLYREPVAWDGLGIALRPGTAGERGDEALVAMVGELGIRHVLLRLHPWETDHAAEERLARALLAAGCDLAFALPQNRELVRDAGRWRAAVEELGARFAPLGRHFQVGQAVNRSKWGLWTVDEYRRTIGDAVDVLRRQPQIEVLGPAVIDFELHVTAALLNLPAPAPRFDALASLLYVDRRGAPENRQAGWDTVDKVLWLAAIAGTARHCGPRSWITEVNWPLREGPHSPAGRLVSVDEEAQADYLVRYHLLALATGQVERVYWWQLVARGYGLAVDEGNGRVRRRPAFAALRTLGRELAGTISHGPRPAPPDVRLYRFSRGADELIVAWSLGPGAEVTLPGRILRVTTRDGAAEPVPAGALRLGPSPRYVVLAP